MSRGLRLFLTATYVAGLVALAVAFVQPSGGTFSDGAVLVLLAYVAEWLAVRLPSGNYSSVSFAIHLGAMMVLGVRVPVVSAVINALQIVDLRARKPPMWIVFNAAQTAIANVAVYGVFASLGGRPVFVDGVLSSGDILAALAAVPAGFVVNAGLVAVAEALETGRSALRVWQVAFRWLIPGYAALSLLGVLLAASYMAAGIAGVLLLVIPLLIARQTFVLYMRRREAYYQTVHALVAAIEAKDSYTRGHSERVADYAERTAEALGLSPNEIEEVRFAALLHDLGKIAVDRGILGKADRLSEREYAIVQEHPERAARILEEVRFLASVVPSIRAHHERIDGMGYGNGIAGDAIPLYARILAVADCFDAMTSARPYRAALSTDEAVMELVRNSGTQFDRNVVLGFLKAADLEHLVHRALPDSPDQLSFDQVSA